MLGLDQDLFVGDGCETHYGEEVQAPAKYTADACRERLILDVPGREGTHTVQDEIDVLDEAWRQCYYSRQTQTGPCPMCSTPAPVVTVAQVTLSGEPHAHFFVAAARTSEGEPEPGAAKPSVSVSAFRTTYRLCAVIFQCTTSIERFFCQAFYGGCWHAQNVWGGKVAHEHLHVYEACPSFKGVRGKAVPVFFAYVREGEEMPADTSEYDSDHEGLSLRTEERKEARKTFNLAMENAKAKARQDKAKKLGKKHGSFIAGDMFADVKLPWEATSSRDYSRVHVALAVSFIQSGYIGGGSAGDTGAAGAGGGGSTALSMGETTVGDADATAAIYALLNRQAAMEKAVLGEKPSERSETLRNLAQNEADFWVSYIYAGILFGSLRWEAKQAAKRGVVPLDLIRSAFQSVRGFKLTHEGRLRWKGLVTGEKVTLGKDFQNITFTHWKSKRDFP